jgi:Zn-dependent peptidase ImmA (M78 family)
MDDVRERVLRLAESSGLTRRAFAERIGLDETKLSKSLSGARRFSSLDLARIAEMCQVTVDWLITGEEPPLAMAARASGGSAAAAFALARRLCVLRGDMAGLGYPQPWQLVTEVTGGSGGFAGQGRALAAAAARRLGEAGRSAADEDLAAAIEAVFGADVTVAALGTDFDGLAASSGGAKIIVLATTAVPARQRFTLAHELGHLLAGDDQEVHLDRDIYSAAQSRDPSEARANSFAAALLMPEAGLRAAVGQDGITEQQFAALATDLMVSPSALAYRLREYRLIDSGGCDKLRKISAAQAAALAGHGREFARRVAAAAAPRPPGLLLRDAYAAYEAGVATLRPYASLLGADVDELRAALESDDGPADAL